MAGRVATDAIIRGRCAISVNDPCHPVPQGWQRVLLTDVAELGTGHTPSRLHPEYWDGNIAWIGIRDAGSHHGQVISDTAQHVTELGLANSAARLLPKDTICLSRTASVGYVVKMGKSMATSQDFVTWSCGDQLDPDFLHKALLAEGEEIRRFGEGSTHTTIYFPEVKAFHIDLPPLAEQRRIVAKLDALTARLARARAELERVSLLGKQLRNASLSAARKAAVEYPTQAVSELLETSFDGPFGSHLRSSDYTDDGVQVVRLENVSHLRFVSEKKTFISFEKFATLTRHSLRPGDVIFSSFVDNNVRVCRLPQELPSQIINKADCFVLRVNALECDAEYLTYALAAPETYEYMRYLVHGATRPRIGLSDLRNYMIHVPGLEHQRLMVREIKAAFARADRLEAEAAHARALLDRLEAAILAKAFRGELVPQDPADEPASVLLDRIRAERAAAPKPKRGRRAQAPRVEP